MIAPFLVPGGAAGLLGAVAWLVYTGRLIPKSVVDQMLSVKNDELSNLRAGYNAEKERNQLLTEQVGELMELSRVTVGIVRAIPKAKDAAA
jgi:hypothetical protein